MGSDRVSLSGAWTEVCGACGEYSLEILRTKSRQHCLCSNCGWERVNGEVKDRGALA